MESFIVRPWAPRDLSDVDRELVCGVVEHVGGERRATLAKPEQLIAFLREGMAARTSERRGVATAHDSPSRSETRDLTDKGRS